MPGTSARPRTKAVASITEVPWDKLPEKERKWRMNLVINSVSAATHRTYVARAVRITEIGGDCDYRGFLRYVRLNEEDAAGKGVQPLRTTTVRQHKSACLHVCIVEDRPWTIAQSIDVDFILSAREGQDTPKVHRGQLDWPKLCAVRLHALSLGYKDIADAFLIVYAACCRGQDIEFLTAENCEALDTPRPTLWSIRKGTAASLVHKGAFTANPICIKEAADNLASRIVEIAKAGGKLLFPFWDASMAAKLLQQVAVKEGWPATVNWSGIHTARTGAARKALDDALDSVLDAGR